MKTFESVYVSADSFDYSYIEVTPADTGIVKIDGCHMFFPAHRNKRGDLYRRYGNPTKHEQHHICQFECKERYGFVPGRGQAWLVKDGENFVTWTREDEHMPLLDRHGTVRKEAKYVECR